MTAKKRSRKTPKTPSGKLGSLTLTARGGKYDQIQFPLTKPEKECWIVERARAAANGVHPFKPGVNLSQNPEDDLDFVMCIDGRKECLELTEIVLGGNGHRDSPDRYRSDRAAKEVLSLIDKKRRRYRSKKKGNIHLLLFTTDYKSRIDDSVTDLVTCYLAEGEHGFLSVSYFVPYAKGNGRFVSLFPMEPEEVEKRRRRRVVKEAFPADLEKIAGSTWTILHHRHSSTITVIAGSQEVSAFRWLGESVSITAGRLTPLRDT